MIRFPHSSMPHHAVLEAAPLVYFGQPSTASFVRLNFATSADNLREIMARIGALS